LRAVLLIAAVLLVGAVLLYYWLAQREVASELLRIDPAAVLRSPKLIAFAQRQAAPVYQQHCASCHGAQREGRAGVPSLADKDWLYGNNLVDLEQIVRYGIRSGNPRSRNLTDMPAFGRIGQLSDDEIEDAVQFVLSLGHQSADAVRATRGQALYTGKGNCYDCHASDARGVTDYGTPSLVGNGWIYGGDHDTLYRSVYSGRHGLCPDRSKTLTPLQIRSLAVSLHEGVPKRE
jgi:cytochrome c oxidase cbb3-type subunit 3